jgi:hypothetical protein
METDGLIAMRLERTEGEELDELDK